MTQPTMIAPPARTYRGSATEPERWSGWRPRKGDVVVCTPAKCGTTWTQTILSLLLNNGDPLPDKLGVLSPWIDANLGEPANTVAAALEAQTRGRVIKTHTPADGFAHWDSVPVIVVFRHPLDIFFSLRKHTANRVAIDPDHPSLAPVAEALEQFIDRPFDADDIDRDSVATIAAHYTQAVTAGRVPTGHAFHYADMRRDPRAAVAAMAQAAGLDASPELIDTVTKATTFDAMKANAAHYAPFAGSGFWKSDKGFFDSGTSQKWRRQVSSDLMARYQARLSEFIPDPAARLWLEQGSGATP